MAKRGRPPKKPSIEPIAPAAWARIKQQVQSGVLSPVHGSELGRLSYLGVFTATQVAAGFRLAEIYGRYERLIGRRRSARSPSYELGFSGGADDRLEDFDHVPGSEKCGCSTCYARRAWHRIQDRLPNALARSSIEDLCVEDRPINPTLHRDAAALLDVLAQAFGIVNAPKNQKPPAPRKRPGSEAEPSAAPQPRANGVDREVWVEAMHALRPDMTPDQVVMAYRLFGALKDRKLFRRSKTRRSNLL